MCFDFVFVNQIWGKFVNLLYFAENYLMLIYINKDCFFNGFVSEMSPATTIFKNTMTNFKKLLFICKKNMNFRGKHIH